MIPVAIRITNFRSFKKEQTFVFPQTPGLYFMQGVNESEPQLEGNAAGKTTIWEALTWCIFGKTSKGLKAGDVNNWEAGKGTRVEFDFITPSGEDCTLIRTWKPNSWRLCSTARPEDFEDLDKAESNYFMGWLGLDYQPWLSTVLMAQKPLGMFLDLEASAKAALFSEVMGLDRWIDYAGKSSKAATSEDMIIRGMERREAEIRGELEALGNTDYRTSRDDWEKQRAKRLLTLETEHEQIIEYSTAKEDLKAAESAEVKARESYRKMNEAAQQVRDELRVMERELNEVDKDLARAEQDERHAENHLVGLEDNEACPQCGQKLDAKKRGKHLDEAEKAYHKARDRTGELHELYEGKREAVKQRNETFQVLQIGVDAAMKKLRQAEDDVAAARRDKLKEDKRLDAIEDEGELLRAEVNPFDAMAQKAERKVARLREDQQDLQEDLDDARHRHSIYSYWVRGFKEIRLQEIAEALTEFEIEVNSAVASLGLLDWELQFQVDRETAKGTMQRGFTTTVLSPHNELPVPWEAWSGGEGQRLRIATNMGLADLIRSRSGSTFNLEVWDEPTQGLSPRGVNDLLESLAHRARQENRQIWLVDHRTYSFGGFAGGATIVKTPSGSRIRQTAV